MSAHSVRSGPSKTDLPVLIVGAGPTGLVLALWLTRLGIPVRIIDKTAEAGTTSRALAVQVRTLEFYRQLDMADALVEQGVKIAGVNLWVKGARAARVPLQQIGEGLTPFPFALVFPQDAHERFLIERLGTLGVSVEHRTELIRFDQHEHGVRAELRRNDGSEEMCEAAYLAGCDGAHSTVREALAIGFPGGTYEGLFYVADVEASGPATDHELHLDLDEADLLIVFPMKGTGRVRLVGTVREAPRGGDQELTFDDVSARAMEHLRLEVAKVNWFSTYRVHHRVAHSYRTGRVFLLGDAAHIHSPVGGQGMNTGIGDAVNLSWKIATVLKKAASERLLDTFEIERIAFAPAGRHDRSHVYPGDCAWASRPIRPHGSGTSAPATRVWTCRRAHLAVPDRVADRDPVSREPTLGRSGRLGAWWRPPAVGASGARAG